MKENRVSPDISRDFNSRRREQNFTLIWPGWTEGKRGNPDTNPQKRFRQKLFPLV